MGKLKFRHDLFISYAHIDNQPYPGLKNGWIDDLHERLEIRLAQLLGRKPVIWRDRKLTGAAAFNDEIKENLADAAILIAVMSPRYLESAACRAEVENFNEFARRQGGIRIGARCRVFKVVKSEIPLEDHPELWQALLGYEFFERNAMTGRVREFDHLIDANRDRRYWDRFEDLAYDLKESINLFQEARSPHGEAESAGQVENASSLTVYLAETTSDLNETRDNVKRELQQSGHSVLPDCGLPYKAAAIEQMAREHLKRSSLSVHLIGEYYALTPETETRTLARIQLDLAGERKDDPDFSRLVWIPPDLNSDDPRQQEFIDEIKQGLGSEAGSELLQVRVEELKSFILSKLSPKSDHRVIKTDGKTDPSVYLIYDNQDYEDARPIEDFLSQQNLVILSTPTEGDVTEISQFHNECLAMCDAVMIFYGRTTEAWAQTKRLDLMKKMSLRPDRPLLSKAFYISAPLTIQKERFKCPDALIIRNPGEFDPTVLNPFLTEIRHRGGSIV